MANDYSCDDNTRRQRDYFLKREEFFSLVFILASVSHDATDGMHVQIILESSTRVVNVKVSDRDGDRHSSTR